MPDPLRILRRYALGKLPAAVIQPNPYSLARERCNHQIDVMICIDVAQGQVQAASTRAELE